MQRMLTFNDQPLRITQPDSRGLTAYDVSYLDASLPLTFPFGRGRPA